MKEVEKSGFHACRHEKKECIAFSGPNGSGKTALLRMLAGRGTLPGVTIANLIGEVGATREWRMRDLEIVEDGEMRYTIL